MTDAFDQSWRAQFQENFGSEGTMTECNDELMSLEELNVAEKAPLFTPAMRTQFHHAVRIANRLKAENEEYRSEVSGFQSILDNKNIQLAEARDAISALLDRHTSLVNSGDCGYWDPEEEGEVRGARDFLAKHNTDEVGSGR